MGGCDSVKNRDKYTVHILIKSVCHRIDSTVISLINMIRRQLKIDNVIQV